MELDPRIIEGKTYLDCFDTEIAKEFIGKECYLSDGVASFANIDNLRKATLIEVVDGDVYPYKLENARWHYGSFFILPCEWVEENKEPEKKYRAFTLNDFLNQYHLGDEIIVRRKLNKDRSIHKLFTEYGGNDDTVHLGTYWFTFKDLYDNYELYTDEGWKPFGVEE